MNPPKYFVIDVDGCLSTGQFHYSVDGKVVKIFGPNDGDALSLLKKYITIHMITGDKRGFPITEKRVAVDMHFPLDLVSTFERVQWIEQHYNLAETIYMGDGLFDALVFSKVAYGIAPANALSFTRARANFVTPSRGGENAVVEACLHVMEIFFKPFDPMNPSVEECGIWQKAT